MRLRSKILLGTIALVALTPGFAAPAMAATPGTCITQPVNGDATHVIGAGQGGTTFSCTYVANGRGGISAATPNRWEVVNEDTNVVVASSDGIVPVASTGTAVCPGDTIRVTMFQELQVDDGGATPPGTYGAIRAGGAGVAPGSCGGT